MTDQELVARALQQRALAYAPYSGFSVGAALLCRDGRVFTGCNVENAAYGSSICAERTALLKAVSEGHQSDWVAMAIVGSGPSPCWPCGSCRQMLYEFAPNLRIIAAGDCGSFSVAALSALLPNGFGRAELNEEK